MQGDFAVAAVLITMGALLGKLTSTQLLWVCVMEIFFYALSEAIVSQVGRQQPPIAEEGRAGRQARRQGRTQFSSLP